MISSDARQTRKPDNTILRALGRAHRWKALLETGGFTSICDLAAAEKINHSYIRRLLRLTLLSPEIIEMILDGWVPRGLHLENLLRPVEMEWIGQRDRLLGVSELLP